jgi:hypothetical protein
MKTFNRKNFGLHFILATLSLSSILAFYAINAVGETEELLQNRGADDPLGTEWETIPLGLEHMVRRTETTTYYTPNGGSGFFGVSPNHSHHHGYAYQQVDISQFMNAGAIDAVFSGYYKADDDEAHIGIQFNGEDDPVRNVVDPDFWETQRKNYSWIFCCPRCVVYVSGAVDGRWAGHLRLQRGR